MEKLRKEISGLDTKGHPLNRGHLRSLKYLQNVMKESTYHDARHASRWVPQLTPHSPPTVPLRASQQPNSPERHCLAHRRRSRPQVANPRPQGHRGGLQRVHPAPSAGPIRYGCRVLPPRAVGRGHASLPRPNDAELWILAFQRRAPTVSRQ